MTFDPENLEGNGPTREEFIANQKALNNLTVRERFQLMFGQIPPSYDDPLGKFIEPCSNPEKK